MKTYFLSMYRMLEFSSQMFVIQLKEIMDLLPIYYEYIQYFKELSIIMGINLPSKVEDASRHGFVFTSIKYILKSLSIMKS